jgi:hypothetical protein
MASDVFDNEDARYVAEARRWPYVLNYRTEGSHEEGMIHNPSTCVHIYPQTPNSYPRWGMTTSSSGGCPLPRSHRASHAHLQDLLTCPPGCTAAVTGAPRDRCSRNVTVM